MTDKIVMFYPYVNPFAVEGAVRVLESRWIGEAGEVRKFEKELSGKFGFPHSIAVNSGTSALRLALSMCGVGPGDEVVTVSQTCSATNTPILEQFAVPVFADIQYETGNIDPLDVEHRITEKTKAIMVVHWAGYPVDLYEVHQLAKRHGLPVIEDAAHALGATYMGRPIGSVSDFTAFSFQAIKHLTTGDGGLLTVLTQEHCDEAVRRRWFGIDRRNRKIVPDGRYPYWNQSEPGYKYHMNDIAAAIGRGNLRGYDQNLAKRRARAAFYRASLKGVPGVRLLAKADDRVSAHWLFTMHVEERLNFCRAMKDAGIEVSIVHIRNDAHDVFGGLRDDLPATERWNETAISIPMHDMLTEEDEYRIVEAIQSGW